MKTYEEEYKELFEWYLQSRSEAEEKIEQLVPVGGYDDRAAPIMHEVNKEFTHRRDELKKKHGITYEYEYNKLLEWFNKKKNEIDKMPPGPDRDNDHAKAMDGLSQDFDRSLRELKERYGIV